MLTIEHLTKQFGKKTLFRDLCLTVKGPAEIGRASCRERVLRLV